MSGCRLVASSTRRSTPVADLSTRMFPRCHRSRTRPVRRHRVATVRRHPPLRPRRARRGHSSQKAPSQSRLTRHEPPIAGNQDTPAYGANPGQPSPGQYPRGTNGANCQDRRRPSRASCKSGRHRLMCSRDRHGCGRPSRRQKSQGNCDPWPTRSFLAVVHPTAQVATLVLRARPQQRRPMRTQCRGCHTACTSDEAWSVAH
mmetsp:Transcript_93410/g.268994  ORF Transcript_93410/g.268994 Transcript_93410/m.268994 type:complete len:202 (-) Transcript_93410:726-1331(-)